MLLADTSMPRGNMMPVSQQPLRGGMTERGLADMPGFNDMELHADQEDLFSTFGDDSPQRPERQFKCGQIFLIVILGSFKHLFMNMIMDFSILIDVSCFTVKHLMALCVV